MLMMSLSCATKTKSNAKKTKTPPVADIQVPMAKELVPEAPIDEVQVPVPAPVPVQVPVPAPAPVVVESHVTMPDTEMKIKTIRKKIVPKPAADARVESAPAPAPATKAEPAPAPIIIPSEGDIPMKIIKKKTKTIPLSHPAK